jgi:hypothetical protein
MIGAYQWCLFPQVLLHRGDDQLHDHLAYADSIQAQLHLVELCTGEYYHTGTGVVLHEMQIRHSPLEVMLDNVSPSQREK